MMIIDDQDNFRLTNVRNQYFAAISANLITLSLGCTVGWTSPALPQLASDDTPLLTGPLTNKEISWIGSIEPLGGFLGSILFGYFISLMGAKRVLLFLTVPTTLIFWLLIAIGNTYYYILIAKFIQGWTGGGIITTVILFVSEISNDDIRGRLGSFFLFARNIGTLIGYILGVVVEYKYVPWLSSLIPIVFLFTFALIPNTPQYYLRIGNDEAAKNALKFYKGIDGNNQFEEKALRREFERLKNIMNESQKCDQIEFADIFNRSALKGIFIGLTLLALTQITACYAIVTYAVMTFTKAGKSVNPNISMIVLGVALCLGSITSAYLADKLGRRKLNLISLMGCTCGLLATALYHYLGLIGFDLSAFAWIPVICLSITIFIGSAGIIPLASICCVEYLPPKIRTYGMASMCGISWISVFISLKIYPLLLEALDLHGCLSIYAAGCIIGFIFVLLVLEETSGTSLDDVGKPKCDNAKA